MTAQILASELSTLIQDSKRKNTELRTAAEKSLQDLKALPNTSEAQLAAGRIGAAHVMELVLMVEETFPEDHILYHPSSSPVVLTMRNSGRRAFLACKGSPCHGLCQEND